MDETLRKISPVSTNTTIPKQKIGGKRIFSTDDSASSEVESPEKSIASSTKKLTPVVNLFEEEINDVEKCEGNKPRISAIEKKSKKTDSIEQRQMSESENVLEILNQSRKIKRTIRKCKIQETEDKSNIIETHDNILQVFEKDEKIKQNEREEKIKNIKDDKLEVNEKKHKIFKRDHIKKPVKKKLQVDSENKNIPKKVNREDKRENVDETCKSENSNPKSRKIFKALKQKNDEKTKQEKSDKNSFMENDFEKLKQSKLNSESQFSLDNSIVRQNNCAVLFKVPPPIDHKNSDDPDSDNSAKLKSDVYKQTAIEDDSFGKISDFSYNESAEENSLSPKKSKKAISGNNSNKKKFKKQRLSKRNFILPKSLETNSQVDNTDGSSDEESICFVRTRSSKFLKSPSSEENDSNKIAMKSTSPKKQKERPLKKQKQSIVKADSSNEVKYRRSSEPSEPKKTDITAKADSSIGRIEPVRSSTDRGKNLKNIKLTLKRLPWFSGDISADSGLKLKSSVVTDRYLEKIIDSCLEEKYKVKKYLVNIRNLKFRPHSHYTITFHVSEDLFIENRRRIEAIFFTSVNREGKVVSILDYPFLQVVQNGIPVDLFDSLHLGYWLPFSMNGKNRLDIFTGGSVPPNLMNASCFTLSKKSTKLRK